MMRIRPSLFISLLYVVFPCVVGGNELQSRKGKGGSHVSSGSSGKCYDKNNHHVEIQCRWNLSDTMVVAIIGGGIVLAFCLLITIGYNLHHNCLNMCRRALRVGKYQKLPSSADAEEGHGDIACDSFEKLDQDAQDDNEKVGRDSFDPWRSLTPPPLPPFPQGARGLCEATKVVARPRDVNIGKTGPGSPDPWRSLAPPPLPPFPEEWRRPGKVTEATVALSPEVQKGNAGSDATDPWRLLAPPPLPPFPKSKHRLREDTEAITAEDKRHVSGSTPSSSSSIIFGSLLAPKYVMRGWKERTRGKNLTLHG